MKRLILVILLFICTSVAYSQNIYWTSKSSYLRNYTGSYPVYVTDNRNDANFLVYDVDTQAELDPFIKGLAKARWKYAIDTIRKFVKIMMRFAGWKNYVCENYTTDQKQKMAASFQQQFSVVREEKFMF